MVDGISLLSSHTNILYVLVFQLSAHSSMVVTVNQSPQSSTFWRARKGRNTGRLNWKAEWEQC